MAVQRFGAISKLSPEKAEKYVQLHANAWEQVNSMIKECHLQNYSIYKYEDFLFSYYEYTGMDYEKDMAKMAADPTTQEWWAECVPCMNPLTDDGPWATMKEIYHLD